MKKKNLLITAAAVACLIVCCLCLMPDTVPDTVRLWFTTPDTVVGMVGKDVITLTDVNVLVNYTYAMNSYTRAGLEKRNRSGEIKSINSTSLNSRIDMVLDIQKAKELKLYPLSEADEITAATEAIQYYYQHARACAAAGVTEESLIRLFAEYKACRLLHDDTVKNVAVTDEEVKARYDELVAKQEAEFAKSPRAVEQYLVDKYSPYNGSSANVHPPKILVFMPEGYRLVKQVLIPFPNDTVYKITEAMHEENKPELEKLRYENLPRIKAQAEEVLAKAKAREDFDVLMKPLIADYFPFDRQLLVKDDSTKIFINTKYSSFMLTDYEVSSALCLDSTFVEAAMALAKVGDMTSLVATDYGYHIIKYVGDVAAGPVAFEDVRDAIKTSLLEEKKASVLKAQEEQWKAALKIEKFPERIP